MAAVTPSTQLLNFLSFVGVLWCDWARGWALAIVCRCAFVALRALWLAMDHRHCQPPVPFAPTFLTLTVVTYFCTTFVRAYRWIINKSRTATNPCLAPQQPQPELSLLCAVKVPNKLSKMCLPNGSLAPVPLLSNWLCFVLNRILDSWFPLLQQGAANAVFGGRWMVSLKK